MVGRFKRRCVCCSPSASFYKPVGVPLRELEEVVLGIDEVEAMRLADLEGLYQADVAEKMGVSRQTVGNMLNRVHQKIADALINGKALRIDHDSNQGSNAPDDLPADASDVA